MSLLIPGLRSLADVRREYIEVIKDDLQHHLVLDFNDQAINRFFEHQMLTSFKKFRGECHRHFKNYSNPEQTHVNPSQILVGRKEDWHFLCDHYMSCAFQAAKDSACLSWGPKPKSRKTTSASSSSTMFSQAMEYELQQALIEQQQIELDEAK
ncbi:CACTA en-spm transposon protein [Cucumis melo var. makuwa]|uniref:CACTA en-spm transposon protein n=1 Tax=Cucumis melo var. makuwa TaxID=1194695 RepID=A0A5D3E0F9_CUCMM|nr:CACTA en-spm transposon protein [Cucumis melo var. makuwa]TYK29386.1 CACTA en-spm transposon protein [Cucumis melo var. makuwa]